MAGQSTTIFAVPMFYIRNSIVCVLRLCCEITVDVFFFLSESVCISAGPLSRTLALPVRHNGSTLSQPSSHLFLAAEHSGGGGGGSVCRRRRRRNVYS